MKNEMEDNFGRALRILVTHLIKNARKIPPPVVQGALDFEKLAWFKLEEATKRTRLLEIAELTGDSSEIHRHFAAYPHQYSKNGYARYLVALKLYRESLGA